MFEYKRDLKHFYVISLNASIKLFLRRTLVRSVPYSPLTIHYCR